MAKDETYLRHLEASLIDQRSAIRVLSGARQVGKSTLCHHYAPHLHYFNLDSPEIRAALEQTPAATWGKDIGAAVLDECQKLPSVFEKVKYAWDEGQLKETILTGSSQILLLKNIRESLAGRSSLHECWPMMLSELAVKTPGKSPPVPLLDKCLEEQTDISSLLEKEPASLIGLPASLRISAENYLLSWGGMPALLHLEENQRADWLRDYIRTFLERDLADLARLNDLEPFRKFQKLGALRAGNILSLSELARDCGVSVDTAKRWMEYLRLSFQTLLLQPYAKNVTSRTIKSPKIYWSDIGLLRELSDYTGPATGALYENHVIAEIHKWIRTMNRKAELFYYRTTSGMEVDLLLETRQKIIGCEIKMREEVRESDARNLRHFAEALGKPWRGGLVIYRGNRLYKLCEPGIWAMPSHRLLG